MKDFEKNVKLYLIFVYFLFAFLLICLLVIKPINFPAYKSLKNNFILSIVLIVAIILSDKFPITYPSGWTSKIEVTVSFALNFAVSFTFVPIQALAISFLSTIIGETFNKKPWYKKFFNGSMTGFTVGITSLAFKKLYISSLSLTSSYNMLVILLGMLIYFLTNLSILYGLLSKINKRKFLDFWIENFKQNIADTISLFPLGVVVIYFLQKNPIMNLFLIPTIVAVYTAVKRRVQIIEETENTLFALADAVDARIPDTMNHTHRVAKLSEDLCNKLKLPTNLTNEIAIASSLHDIGKISIPDAILNKNGKLTEEEYKIIKKHSEEGAKIASRLSLFKEGAKLIKHHHERYDGKGYPDGLKGEKIPFGARVINIADSFDTMTTPRNYRPYTKSIQEALEEVEKCKGTQFDPQISDAFIEMVKSDLERYYELIKLGKVIENN
jgi:putative nucleotidyltransferase with HDIG domain